MNKLKVEPLENIISLDVNPAPAANHLREAGGWGVAIIFMILLYFVWRYFTKSIKSLVGLSKKTLEDIVDKHNITVSNYVEAISENEDKHILELKNQRDEFIRQIGENTQLLERRHEQFINLIKDNQNTISTGIELNRQEIDLMGKVEDSLKDVYRVIKRCKPVKDDD